MPEPLSPKRWLAPDLSEERKSQQWAAISQRLAKGEGRGFSLPNSWGARVWAGGLLAVAAVALAIGFWPTGFWPGSGKDQPSESAAAPSAVSGSPRLSLADGSQVTLDPDADLSVLEDRPESVLADLKKGRASFVVTHNAERPFVVRAKGVEVRVVGTKFEVAVSASEVRVQVTEGVVLVRSERRPDEVSRLHAGESWSQRLEEVPALLETAEPVLMTSAATAEPAAMAPTTRSPKDLFEQANAARRSGDTSRARSLYGELLARYPDDARAKLAALELGRMELDRAGGSDAAESSLKAASSSEPGTPLHEDALARLVQVYDQKGDTASCRREKTRYLAAYPSGVRASQVRAACASKP